MRFQTMSQLGDTLKGIATLSNGSVSLQDASRIRGAFIDRLAWTAAFHERAEMRGTARWLIKMFAAPLGIDLAGKAKLQTLPRSRFPAIYIKGMYYDMARFFFHSGFRHSLEICLFVSGTQKKQAGETATFIAAAIQEGFRGRLIFKEKDALEKNSSAVVLETALKAFRGNKKPEISITENPEERALQISVSVFSETEVPLEEQEAFLWQWASVHHEQVSLKIGNKLERHFKKYNELPPLSVVRHKGSIRPVSFALRDEIVAANAEPNLSQNQAFFESL